MGNYKSMAKIHDECIDYETSIETSIEELGDKRYTICCDGDREDLRSLIGILDRTDSEGEEYRSYLLRLLKGGETGEQDIADPF